jgi:hypothetical protein
VGLGDPEEHYSDAAPVCRILWVFGELECTILCLPIFTSGWY